MGEPLDLAQALAPLLSRLELRTAYAIQWVAHSYGAYGAGEMAPEQFEQTFDYLGSALIFGVLRMHQAGHQFEALSVSDDDGDVRPIPGASLTPGNMMTIHMLATGRPINFLQVIQDALEFVNDNELDLDTAPLREAQDEILRELEKTRAEMDPETAREIAEARRKVLQIGEAISRGGMTDVGKPIN